MLTTPVPSVVVPSLKVTVPVGDPVKAGVIVAVKVTACPLVDGFSEEVTLIVVVAFFTVCVNAAEVLARKLALPP